VTTLGFVDGVLLWHFICSKSLLVACTRVPQTSMYRTTVGTEVIVCDPL